MKYLYALATLLLALFLAAFIQQNGQAIALKYFSWSTPPLPLSLYMILAFGAGYGLALLVGFASGVRFRFRASAAERELRKVRSEVDALREKAGNAREGEKGPSPASKASPTREITKGGSSPAGEDPVVNDDGEETVLYRGEEEK